MRKIIGFLAAASVLFAISSAFAQEAPKETVRVSGLMYLQWMKEVERPSGGENRNGFDIQRMYLNFMYRIDDIWSTRATVDVGNDGGDGRYQAFLKFGYVQAASDLGFGRLTFQFGLIGTSVLGFVDRVSDWRWLGSNYIDGSALVFHNQGTPGQLSGRNPIFSEDKGQSLDSSADLGAGLSLSVQNLVTLDIQVTNGEGFKKTKEITDSNDGNDDGKAYLAMLSVTPFQGLALAGYYRYCITDDSRGSDNYINYYGGTAAYQFQGVRVGATFLLARVSTMKEADTRAKVAKYRLIDAFLMANMKSLTGVPLLIAGRYVMGATNYARGYAVSGQKAEAAVWAAGLGWQFNDRVRAMAYYEHQTSSSDDIPDADWNDPARNFWIKTEVSF